jgi:hypothetical protein
MYSGDYVFIVDSVVTLFGYSTSVGSFYFEFNYVQQQGI